MRRLLAAGCLTAAVALVAACGDGGDSPPADAGSPTDNTAQVCADAENVQVVQVQRFQQEIAELQQQDLSQEEYEQGALQHMEQALLGWSDGLQEQAERADDPQLTEALSGLADGLAEAAPQLTVESVRTGEIPGAERLDSYGETLTELCGS